jgi:hypothetical protein
MLALPIGVYVYVVSYVPFFTHHRAMGGTVTFQEALAARLGAMQPSQDDMRRFLEQHPPQVAGWLAGCDEVVAMVAIVFWEAHKAFGNQGPSLAVWHLLLQLMVQ